MLMRGYLQKGYLQKAAEVAAAVRHGRLVRLATAAARMKHATRPLINHHHPALPTLTAMRLQRGITANTSLHRSEMVR